MPKITTTQKISTDFVTDYVISRNFPDVTFEHVQITKASVSCKIGSYLQGAT